MASARHERKGLIQKQLAMRRSDINGCYFYQATLPEMHLTNKQQFIRKQSSMKR